jgi:hypothetical protein
MMKKLLTIAFLLLSAAGLQAQTPAGGYSSPATGSGGGGGSLTLQTNGTPNGSQTLLNFAGTTNLSIVDNGAGTVTFSVIGLSPAPLTLTPVANTFVTGYTQSTGVWTTGQVIGNSVNGALSAPAYTLSGTIISGGTGTNTVPLWYYNCTGATAPTAWNTNGTLIGGNGCTGFTGNYIDFRAVNGGATVFNVSATGGVTSAGSIEAAGGSAIGMNARTQFRSAVDGRVAANTNANGSNGITRFTFGTEAVLNPAFCFDGATATIAACDGGGTNANGIFSSGQYTTATNCLQSVSPAACGANVAGRVALAAAGTTLVVNTTKVTANSEVILQRDDSLGTALAITCNTQSTLVLGTPRVTARTAGTSFTITVDAAPTTNALCISYWIMN